MLREAEFRKGRCCSSSDTIYQDNVEQAEAELNTAPGQSGIMPEQLCPYAGSCESDAVKPDTGVTVEIECCHFTSGSQQRRSCTEYGTDLGCTVRRHLMGLSSRNPSRCRQLCRGSLQPVTPCPIYKDDLPAHTSISLITSGLPC